MMKLSCVSMMIMLIMVVGIDAFSTPLVPAAAQTATIQGGGSRQTFTTAAPGPLVPPPQVATAADPPLTMPPPPPPPVMEEELTRYKQWNLDPSLERKSYYKSNSGPMVHGRYGIPPNERMPAFTGGSMYESTYKQVSCSDYESD